MQSKIQLKYSILFIMWVLNQILCFINQDQNLINSVKLTSSRDFRLNVQKLQDLLSKQNNSDVRK